MTGKKHQFNPNLQIETATLTDLEGINHVIKAAIMQWKLPERIKRLSLSSYLYNELDLKHLDILIVKQNEQVIAVASLEMAEIKNTPLHKSGLLLHGLYVHPANQQQGIGKQLLFEAEKIARIKNVSGLLVKAQKDAVDFFLKQNFIAINTDNTSNQYANLLWCSINS